MTQKTSRVDQFFLEGNWIGIDAVAYSLGPRYSPLSDTPWVYESEDGRAQYGRELRFEDNTGGTLDVLLKMTSYKKKQVLEVTSQYAAGDPDTDGCAIVTKRLTDTFDSSYSVFGCAVDLMSCAMEESRRRSSGGNFWGVYRGIPRNFLNCLRAKDQPYE